VAASSSSFTIGDDLTIGGGGSEEPTGDPTKLRGVDEVFIPPMTGGGGRPPYDLTGAAAGAEGVGMFGTTALSGFSAVRSPASFSPPTKDEAAAVEDSACGGDPKNDLGSVTASAT
jgi:hypothetical protein